MEMTRYVARINAGRLQTDLSFDAESFRRAYEITERERQNLVEQLPHLPEPRVIFLREGKAKKSPT